MNLNLDIKNMVESLILLFLYSIPANSSSPIYNQIGGNDGTGHPFGTFTNVEPNAHQHLQIIHQMVKMQFIIKYFLQMVEMEIQVLIILITHLNLMIYLTLQPQEQLGHIKVEILVQSFNLAMA